MLSTATPARLAWSSAAGAISNLYRALDMTNGTHMAWQCESAARGFRAAAEHVADPYRTQLAVLADCAEAMADPFGPSDTAIRACIEAAIETEAALERAMLEAEAGEIGRAA